MKGSSCALIQVSMVPVGKWRCYHLYSEVNHHFKYASIAIVMDEKKDGLPTLKREDKGEIRR